MTRDLEIKAEIKSLKRILCDDDFFYQIPDYQRPYAWDKDNLSDLIDDLFNAYQDNRKEKYFCGSLVLVYNEKAERYDIIDGQQRMTTFIILSCVFRDFHRNDLGDRANSFTKKSIQDEFKAEKRKLTLLTDEKYQNTFEQKVLKKIQLEEGNKKPENKYPDNRYLQNAHYLRDFIQEKLNEHQVKINDFIAWIFENVVLTTITCPSQDTAIQIFNVLNDRGMPLTSVDIIKSTLMSRLSLSYECRNTFKSDWDKVVNSLKSRDLSIENLFTLYLYYTITANPKTTLHKELLDSFKDKDSLELIYDIGLFANSYIDVLTSEDKHIYCLKYLRHSVYWQSILTTAKFTKYESYDELKNILVAYYYQNWISGATTARIKQTSFNILRMVKNNEPLNNIKQAVIDNLNSYNTTSSFYEELKTSNVYGKKWDKPLLLLLEYFSKDDSNQNFIELKPQIHIEHILPQNSNKNWEQFCDEEKEKWTNSLANLTLLSMRKNIQASNESFEKKKEVYTNEDNVATSFEITGQLFNKIDEWNVENLETRQEQMIEKLKENLDIF